MKENILILLTLVFLFFGSACEKQDTDKPYAELKSLPVGAVKPAGWISTFLEQQRDGLTGHLEVAGEPFTTNLWMPPFKPDGSNDSWWPYEQAAYWIDGMVRCGYLLEDSMLIEKAEKQIKYVISHPDSAGYLGPNLNEENKLLRWPHAVFFRSVMAYYDQTGDEKALKALKKHYLHEDYAYSGHREVVNIESILYAYEKTKDTALLNMAKRMYDRWELTDSSDASPISFVKSIPVTEHGVTYNEQAKLGAIMYLYTGDKRYLEQSVLAYERVLNHHMLADGMHSCTENMREVQSLESHEACDISDFTWSLEYMLMATGNMNYADRIEKVIFNALPGQVTNDFKALQYFSCPNQIIASNNSNHNAYHRGNTSMRYAPSPWVEVQCCPANISRAMPNYVANMWMKDKNEGLVAVMYGPSVVNYTSSSGESITIVEETSYPFEESIAFRLILQKKVSANLSFRIPGWAQGYTVHVNGEAYTPNEYGDFLVLNKQWENDDVIQLKFHQELKEVHWPDNGISFERGPLVYALNIKQNRQIDHTETCSSAEFPALELYPASEWNYAALESTSLAEAKVEQVNESSYPFNDSIYPLKISLPMLRLTNWTADKRKQITVEKWGPVMERDSMVDFRLLTDVKLNGDFVLTPQLPSQEFLQNEKPVIPDTIELVPYGSTKLRITVFPFMQNPVDNSFELN